MINFRPVLKSIIALAIILLLITCTGPGLTVIKPSAEEENIIKSKGEKIALELVKSLKTEVKKAIEKDGVSGAITVCNEKAIPLTHQVEEAQNEIVSIKRTSFQYRNPENAPDEIETLALNYYEGLINQQQEIPSFYSQKVIRDGLLL